MTRHNTHPDKANVRISRQSLHKDGEMLSDNIVITIECSTEDLGDVVWADIQAEIRAKGKLTIGAAEISCPAWAGHAERR